MTDGGRRGDSKYRSAAAPSRGLAPTGKPPYNTRGPFRRSLSAIAVQGCESARGPDADRHVKLLIQFAVVGSLSGAYSQIGFEATIGGSPGRGDSANMLALKQQRGRRKMELFVGLDVSLAETSLSVVDEKGA